MTSAVLNFVRTQFGDGRFLRTKATLPYLGIMAAFSLMAVLILIF